MLDFDPHRSPLPHLPDPRASSCRAPSVRIRSLALPLLALAFSFSAAATALGATRVEPPAAKPASPKPSVDRERATAASERAAALAASAHSSADLDDALALVRRFLVNEPAGELSDRLRVRLCATRRTLGAGGRPDSPPLAQSERDTEPAVELDVTVPTPPTFLRQRMRGDQRAVVESTIDADGCVTPERVVESTSPEWALFAKERVASWVFRPATAGGRPVSVRYHLTVKYKRR